MRQLASLQFRFFALIVITLAPILGLVAYTGFPDGGLVLAATALAFVGAWVGSDLLILRRVNNLMQATERLSAGDLTTRVSIPRPLQDWSQLATAFNRMADSLESRENELRDAEVRYRSLVEQIPAVTYAARLDDQNSPMYVSPQVELYLGFTPEEWLADRNSWTSALHPEDRERILDELEQSRSSGVPFCAEYRLITRDGRAVWVRDQAVFMRDAAGNPLFLQGIWLDVDERRQTELELGKADEEIRRLNFELEQRVVERTAELEETNRILTHEIAMHGQSEAALRQSEERFRLLAENARDLIYRYRFLPERGFEYVSPSATRLTGYTPEEHYADPDLGFKLVHPDDRSQFEQTMNGTLDSTSSLIVRWVRKDGGILWTEQAVTPIYDGGGTLVAIEGIARDITERRQTMDALRKANDDLVVWASEMEQRKREAELLNRLGDLLQSCYNAAEAYQVVSAVAPELFTPDGGALYILDPSRSLVEAVAKWGDPETAAVEDVFAPDSCWAMRRGHLHIVQDSSSDLICQHIKSTTSSQPKSYICVPMLAQGESLGVLYLQITPDGQLTEAKQRLAVSAAEHIALAVSSLRLRESLHAQAIRDPLTGLYNRRYMEDSFERELRRGARRKGTVGVIMIDMDHFKQFNDNFGHETGDAVLRNFGRFLERHVREEDIACRYGGEEFMLILPDMTLAATLARAELIRSDFKEHSPQYCGHARGSLSISLGVAVFPEHGASRESVLRAADLALYQAKANGRNRVMAADRIGVRRSDTLSDIGRA